MKSSRSAMVLGASDSVGNALFEALLESRSFCPIVGFVRRLQPHQLAVADKAQVGLREILLPAMDPADLKAATK